LKGFQRFLILKIVVPLAVFLFKLMALTFRIREINTTRMSPYQGKEKQYIYAFLHSQQLATIYFYRNTKMGSLASLSKDGEIAAAVAEAFGIKMLRGSSSRGGAAALMGLKSLIEKGYDVALTVDGPRGPIGTVNSGVIYLAKLTGREIVTSCFCCTKNLRMRSWDRFLVPLPFTKGYFNFGKPIAVPADLPDDRIPEYKELVRVELERINKECEDFMVSQNSKVKSQK
jgi:lysophospholipid acyltransferase (LPLAT)-like uncharacterized protein